MNTHQVSRRSFVKTTATVGTGLALSGVRTGAATPPPSDRINVAVVGCGAQAQVLRESLQAIDACRIVAVADIWPYRLKYITRHLKAEGTDVNGYADHHELLEKQKDLDAVVVATPDFSHARITNDCLKAGKHVYCEKAMSNTLDGAKSMVRTMRETGKLLQIGYQRRSNPRYLHALNQLLRGEKICGQIVAVNGQWNRGVMEERRAPKSTDLDAETLARYGFASMRELMNWRWFRKLSGGPIMDVGSYSLDVFNWFLGCMPRTVFASGGRDYYKDREWYDNAMIVSEYTTPEGSLRAFYQIQTASSYDDFYERFMGSEGALKISEIPALSHLVRERRTHDMPDRREVWDRLEATGSIQRKDADFDRLEDAERVYVCPTCCPSPLSYAITTKFNQRVHQPHLENFFNAIRGEAKLNCPADEALRSEYGMYKALESMETRRMLTIDPKDATA